MAEAIADAVSCATKSAVSSTAPVAASTRTLQECSAPASAIWTSQASRTLPFASGCQTSFAGIARVEMPPREMSTSLAAPPFLSSTLSALPPSMSRCRAAERTASIAVRAAVAPPAAAASRGTNRLPTLSTEPSRVMLMVMLPL
jgi:hypothetical protein